MTRKDLKCIHEPFGDAFYFGPERLGSRYEHDEQARLDSGFGNATYKGIFDNVMASSAEVGYSLSFADWVSTDARLGQAGRHQRHNALSYSPRGRSVLNRSVAPTESRLRCQSRR